MLNKISLVATVCLAAVCLGLLWQHQGAEMNHAPALSTAAAKPAIEKMGKGTISVSSVDQRMFIADEYVLNFDIVSQNKDKGKAFAKVNADRDKILALFKKLSIADNQVVPSSVETKKDWSYTKGKRVDEGYVVSQHFKVTLSSKDSAEVLEQELAQLSFVDKSYMFAQLKDAESMEMETIKSACKKAKQKADEYAQSVGAKVGTAVTVNGASDVDTYNASDSVGVSAVVQVAMRLLGKNDSRKSFITVHQLESKKFLADKFVVPAHIELEGANKESLYGQVSEKRHQIEELLKNLGVAESDVETESVSIVKKPKWRLKDDGGKNPIEASQTIRVNFHAKDAAAAFYTALADIDKVTPLRVDLALSNEDSLRIQVTKLAGHRAIARAKALAEGFGGKMGDVVNVSDNCDEGTQEYSMALEESKIQYAPAPRGKTVLASRVGYNDVAAGLLGVGGASGMNIADSVEISSFISVVTELKY